MKKYSRLYLWLPSVGLAILFTVTAGLGSAPAYAHHCKGQHKNDPGCPGGNDPGAEIAVSVLFDCPVAANRDCPNAMTPDRIQGDIPLDDYRDGEQDVRTHIRESGVLQFRTDAKGEKPGTRNVYWNLGGVLSLSSGEPLTTTDDLPPGYGHASVIQVGRGSGGLDFLTLANEDDTADTSLWANLIIKPNSGPKEHFFIRFEDPAIGDQCPETSGADPVTVTRLAGGGDGERRWEVVGADGAIACEQESGQDVALGPFRFVVTENVD